MSQLPMNPPARDIVRLRSINADIDHQINELRARQAENSELIGSITWAAVWDDSPPTGSLPIPPGEVPPTPETIPEVDPVPDQSPAE